LANNKFHTLQGINIFPPGEVWKIIDSKVPWYPGYVIVPWRVSLQKSHILEKILPFSDPNPQIKD